jgi:hypothetical protein
MGTPPRSGILREDTEDGIGDALAPDVAAAAVEARHGLRKLSM